jgi:O-antigen/teichoic acid export membrane protein
MDKLKKTAFLWLKKSEKYTKTDMIYLAKGGSWLGFGQAVSLCIALLTSIIFANLLDPESYGIYKYIISIGALLALPTLSGMDSAITRTVAQGFEGTIYKALKEKLVYGTLTMIIGCVLSFYYFFNENSTLGISFLIISICIPFWESFDIYNSLLNGKKLFDKYTKYYALSQLFSFIAITSSLIISKNVIVIISTYFISNTIIRIIFFYKCTNEIKPNKEINMEAISYGKHLSIMDIIGTFLGQIDKILIFHLLGATQLALYTIAIAPTEQIKGSLKSLHTLALPKFSIKSKHSIKSSIFDKTLRLGILVGVIIIFYILVSPHFFNIFFPKYTDAVIYSQILSVSLIGATLCMFLYTYLESHGEQKKLYQFNIYSNILNALIIFGMIYYYGIWGAILGRVVVRFLLLLLSLILVKKS